MGKDFQHRDYWFYVLPYKQPGWRGESRKALHLKLPLKPHLKVHTYYVEKDKTHWTITAEDLKAKMQLVEYVDTWHIAKEDLTFVAMEDKIDDKLRQSIESYGRNK